MSNTSVSSSPAMMWEEAMNEGACKCVAEEGTISAGHGEINEPMSYTANLQCALMNKHKYFLDLRANDHQRAPSSREWSILDLFLRLPQLVVPGHPNKSFSHHSNVSLVAYNIEKTPSSSESDSSLLVSQRAPMKSKSNASLSLAASPCPIVFSFEEIEDNAKPKSASSCELYSRPSRRRRRSQRRSSLYKPRHRQKCQFINNSKRHRHRRSYSADEPSYNVPYTEHRFRHSHIFVGESSVEESSEYDSSDYERHDFQGKFGSLIKRTKTKNLDRRQKEYSSLAARKIVQADRYDNLIAIVNKERSPITEQKQKENRLLLEAESRLLREAERAERESEKDMAISKKIEDWAADVWPSSGPCLDCKEERSSVLHKSYSRNEVKREREQLSRLSHTKLAEENGEISLANRKKWTGSRHTSNDDLKPTVLCDFSGQENTKPLVPSNENSKQQWKDQWAKRSAEADARMLEIALYIKAKEKKKESSVDAKIDRGLEKRAGEFREGTRNLPRSKSVPLRLSLPATEPWKRQGVPFTNHRVTRDRDEIPNAKSDKHKKVPTTMIGCEEGSVTPVKASPKGDAEPRDILDSTHIQLESDAKLPKLHFSPEQLKKFEEPKLSPEKDASHEEHRAEDERIDSKALAQLSPAIDDKKLTKTSLTDQELQVKSATPEVKMEQVAEKREGSAESPSSDWSVISSAKSIVKSTGINALGLAVWDQMSKIQQQNASLKFPNVQRKGFYEPPTAYPIYIHAEDFPWFRRLWQRHRNLEEESQETEPIDQTPSASEKYSLLPPPRPSTLPERVIPTISRSFGVAVESAVNIAPHVPHGPSKTVTCERKWGAIDNLRELRLCCPSVPLSRQPAYDGMATDPVERLCRRYIPYSFMLSTMAVPLPCPRHRRYNESSCPPLTRVAKYLPDVWAKSELDRTPRYVSPVGDRFYFDRMFKGKLSIKNIMAGHRNVKTSLRNETNIIETLPQELKHKPHEQAAKVKTADDGFRSRNSFPFDPKLFSLYPNCDNLVGSYFQNGDWGSNPIKSYQYSSERSAKRDPILLISAQQSLMSTTGTSASVGGTGRKDASKDSRFVFPGETGEFPGSSHARPPSLGCHRINTAAFDTTCCRMAPPTHQSPCNMMGVNYKVFPSARVSCFCDICQRESICNNRSPVCTTNYQSPPFDFPVYRSLNLGSPFISCPEQWQTCANRLTDYNTHLTSLPCAERLPATFYNSDGEQLCGFRCGLGRSRYQTYKSPGECYGRTRRGCGTCCSCSCSRYNRSCGEDGYNLCRNDHSSVTPCDMCGYLPSLPLWQPNDTCCFTTSGNSNFNRLNEVEANRLKDKSRDKLYGSITSFSCHRPSDLDWVRLGSIRENSNRSNRQTISGLSDQVMTRSRWTNTDHRIVVPPNFSGQRTKSQGTPKWKRFDSISLSEPYESHSYSGNIASIVKGATNCKDVFPTSFASEYGQCLLNKDNREMFSNASCDITRSYTDNVLAYKDANPRRSRDLDRNKIFTNQTRASGSSSSIHDERFSAERALTANRRRFASLTDTHRLTSHYGINPSRNPYRSRRRECNPFLSEV